MTRSECLDYAKDIVLGDRESTYNGPEDSFRTIAELWSTYLNAKGNILLQGITPSDVAAMMGLLKLARIAASPDHGDSWVDLAGYAACGAEVSTSPVIEVVGE